MVYMDTLLNHLKSRHFNPDLYQGLGLDGNVLTLPLWNQSGVMVGYQVYDHTKPKGSNKNPREQRYFTYVTPGQSAVWGLETLHNDGPLYLTEGVFDACRLHSRGFQAVAVLTNNPQHLLSWLYALTNTVIAAVQGDQPGRKLAGYTQYAVYLTEGKDVGDLTEQEFNQFFRK